MPLSAINFNGLKGLPKSTYNDRLQAAQGLSGVLTNVAQQAAQQAWQTVNDNYGGGDGGGGGGGYSGGGGGGGYSGGGGGGGGGYSAPSYREPVYYEPAPPPPPPNPYFENGYAANYRKVGAPWLMQNPEAMLAGQLVGQGGPLYELMAQSAAQANPLFMATYGQSADTGSDEQFINYLNDYWTNMRTPGKFYDWASAMNHVLNPTGPLADYLGGDNASDQVSHFGRLVSSIAEQALAAPIANALRGELDRRGMEYIDAAARAEQSPYYQWVQGKMPQLGKLFGG